MTGGERGSAAVVALGVFALGAVLVLGLARLGRAAVTRAQADAAAEFGALAAADQVALGAAPIDVCAVARATVERNHARMTGCTADADGARVQVARDARGLSARGHARAVIDAECAPGVGSRQPASRAVTSFTNEVRPSELEGCMTKLKRR